MAPMPAESIQENGPEIDDRDSGWRNRCRPQPRLRLKHVVQPCFRWGRSSNRCMPPRALRGSSARVCLPWRDIPLLAGLLLRSFAGLSGYLQIVLHAEDSRDSICPQKRGVFVCLRVDRSIELHVPVLY